MAFVQFSKDELQMEGLKFQNIEAIPEESKNESKEGMQKTKKKNKKKKQEKEMAVSKNEQEETKNPEKNDDWV